MDDKEKMRFITKWIISIVAVCIIIFLGVRHIKDIAKAVVWIVDIFKPLLIGIIIALIINVPMSFIESHILKKIEKRNVKRALSIVLSILFMAGIFVGSAVVVIPELINAIKIIVQIVTGGLDQLVNMNSNARQIQAMENYILQFDVDWPSIKKQLETWFISQQDKGVDHAIEFLESAVCVVVTGFISFVFSIYILAQKENLKRQICRLIEIWLPDKIGKNIIHVADVSGRILKQFIACQAIEAVIIGVLCTIGMLILRIPYAIMVGVLMGVTALFPLVGAYAGTIVGAIIILTENPFKSLIFIIFIIILQQVEGNVIYPRTVGSRIKISALWVLAAVVVGGRLAGPLGMFLGVPIASSILFLIKEVTDEKASR